MANTVVVYYDSQFYSSATTYLVLIILEKSYKSVNSQFTVLYNNYIAVS